MNRGIRSFSIYHKHCLNHRLKHRLKHNPRLNTSVQTEEPGKPENKCEEGRKTQSTVNLNQQLSQTPTLSSKTEIHSPLDKNLDSWLVDN